MNRRLRVLVVTNEAYPGHEFRDLRIALELRKRGHQVRHMGPGEGLKRHGFLWSTFSSSFAELPEAREANTRLFDNWSQLDDGIIWCDIVVLGVAKGYERAGHYARSLGRIVIQHRDTGGYDPWTCTPHLMTARGPWESKGLLEVGPPLEAEPVVTGGVLFDAAAPQNRTMTREQFCEYYGLDPTRKIALFLPESPANHTDRYRSTYSQVLRAIADAGFQHVIKPHPKDYARVKQGVNYKDTVTPSWQQIDPTAIAIEPHHKYEGFAAADALISRSSTVCMETPLFNKPLLYVDRLESFADYWNWEDRDVFKRLFGVKRFDGVKMRTLTPEGPIENQASLLPDDLQAKFREMRAGFERSVGKELPEFIGAEATVEELPEVLSSASLDLPDTVYQDFLNKYCFKNDGLAYMRICDQIEGCAELHPLSRKFRRSRLLRPFQTLRAQFS